MKKNILLALCCCSLLAFTGCSDDYTDERQARLCFEPVGLYGQV